MSIHVEDYTILVSDGLVTVHNRDTMVCLSQFRDLWMAQAWLRRKGVLI